MRKGLAFVALFGLLVALASSSEATGADVKKKPVAAKGKGKVDVGLLFGKLDTNNDQKLSLAEFSKFDQADPTAKNKNAVGAFSNAQKGELFKKFDTDKDNSLTLEEFSQINETINGKEPEVKKKKKK